MYKPALRIPRAAGSVGPAQNTALIKSLTAPGRVPLHNKWPPMQQRMDVWRGAVPWKRGLREHVTGASPGPGPTRAPILDQNNGPKLIFGGRFGGGTPRSLGRLWPWNIWTHNCPGPEPSPAPDLDLPQTWTHPYPGPGPPCPRPGPTPDSVQKAICGSETGGDWVRKELLRVKNAEAMELSAEDRFAAHCGRSSRSRGFQP